MPKYVNTNFAMTIPRLHFHGILYGLWDGCSLRLCSIWKMKAKQLISVKTPVLKPVRL